MNRIATYMSIFALGAVLTVRADDLPTKFSFDRYKGLVDHSPFAVATAVLTPEATPNFAKNLYVANAARSPDGDMVTIMSMDDKDFKISDHQGAGRRLCHRQHRVVGQSGRD
jgi:hypothetical protein